jgi:hypothetical protein
MNIQCTTNLKQAVVALIMIGMWGCAAQPFDPPRSGEIPPGPGVFSKGDDGFVLYDSNKTKADGRTDAAGASTTESGAARSEDASDVSDFAEFEAYQEFKAWKKSALGTREYEEFQQWRRWRQYREWKQQQ